MTRTLFLSSCVAALLSCSRTEAPVRQVGPAATAASPPSRRPPRSTSPPRPTLQRRPTPRSRPVPPPAISAQEAARILFPAARGQRPEASASRALQRCAQGAREARVRCLLARRYRGDARAKPLAVQLYGLTGSVVGLEPARRMDGGWRGKLRLVPELPVGRHRRHLRRITAAFRDIHEFVTALGKAKRKDTPQRLRYRYRYRALAIKVFRSVKRRTPSAYAWSWSVAYNVNGSLLRTKAGVRETLFHELFHLNDAAQKGWSERALTGLYSGIVQRCTRGRGKRKRLSNHCLTPFAPHRTRVMGGTYYAFHPESGVGEYAAELAVRYFLEHRAVLRKGARLPQFKCRTPENARAWGLLAGAFFGGVDLTPACR